MENSNRTLPNVEKIKKGPLREQVRARIKKLILTNYLLPGQHIVIDRLARELGVSQTPVREALAMLTHEGLVKLKPYGNPQVAGINASDVREVWEMRLLLEGWAIVRAIPVISEEALDEMVERLEIARQDALLSLFDAHFESDIELHRLITESVDQRLFLHLARLVEDRSIRIRSLVEATGSPQDVLTIIDEHCAILEALRARDAELACERLISHLTAGMQRTLVALEKIVAGEQ